MDAEITYLRSDEESAKRENDDFRTQVSAVNAKVDRIKVDNIRLITLCEKHVGKIEGLVAANQDLENSHRILRVSQDRILELDDDINIRCFLDSYIGGCADRLQLRWIPPRICS